MYPFPGSEKNETLAIIFFFRSCQVFLPIFVHAAGNGGSRRRAPKKMPLRNSETAIAGIPPYS
jgi:hypothetical protein